MATKNQTSHKAIQEFFFFFKAKYLYQNKEH